MTDRALCRVILSVHGMSLLRILRSFLNLSGKVFPLVMPFLGRLHREMTLKGFVGFSRNPVSYLLFLCQLAPSYLGCRLSVPVARRRHGTNVSMGNTASWCWYEAPRYGTTLVLNAEFHWIMLNG